MTGPLISDAAVADLTQQNVAGLRHTARQRFSNEVRQPLGEYVGTVRYGEPICCVVKGINATQATLAATLGFKADYTMKVAREQRLPSGSIWEVTTDDCVDAVFAVEVTGDLVRVGRTMRLVAAKDVSLDR